MPLAYQIALHLKPNAFCSYSTNAVSARVMVEQQAESLSTLRWLPVVLL